MYLKKIQGGDEMNKEKLLWHMRCHGDRQSDLAEAIGLSRSRLSSKINGKGSFTQPEILAIKRRYRLSGRELDEIFFA